MLNKLLNGSSIVPNSQRIGCLILIKDEENFYGKLVAQHIQQILAKRLHQMIVVGMNDSPSSALDNMKEYINTKKHVHYVDAFTFSSSMGVLDEDMAVKICEKRNSNLSTFSEGDFLSFQYLSDASRTLQEFKTIFGSIIQRAKSLDSNCSHVPLFFDSISRLIHQHGVARVMSFIQSLRRAVTMFESSEEALGVRLSPIIINLYPSSYSGVNIMSMEDIASIIVTTPSPSCITTVTRNSRSTRTNSTINTSSHTSNRVISSIALSSKRHASLDISHFKVNGKVESETMWLETESTNNISKKITTSTTGGGVVELRFVRAVADDLIAGTSNSSTIDPNLNKSNKERTSAAAGDKNKPQANNKNMDVLTTEQKLAKDSVVLPYEHQGGNAKNNLIVFDADDTEFVASDSEDEDGLDDDLDL